MDLRKKAKDLMLANWQATGKKYITPSWPHYKYFWSGWDSPFHAIILAELGMKNLAKEQIRLALSYQHENGWIPNMAYCGKFRWYDLERYTFKDWRYHSNYSQPLILAQAAAAIDSPNFTRQILPAVIRAYTYFLEKQDPDNDGLISICHPCESGRDNDPTFDRLRKNLNGPFKPGTFLGQNMFKLKLNWRYRRVGWDIDRIWQLDLFNLEDVAFNCIWVDGMRTLERLVEDAKIRRAIKHLADWVERAIYQKMWHEDWQMFYALDSQNRPVKCLTVSNLLPLILPNIPERMLKALIKVLTDRKKFWTDYPVPSVPRDNPDFDPDGTKSIWRGPTGINMNWFIIQGLVRHARKYSFLLDIADIISQKTIEMVEREGFWEFFQPFTGQGMRVKDFSWSGLLVTFPRIFTPT